MQFIFLILTILNFDQTLLVRSTMNSFEVTFTNNLVNSVNLDLLNSISKNLQISLEENKAVFLDSFTPLLNNFCDMICNLISEMPIENGNSIFQIIDDVASDTSLKSSGVLQNLAGVITNGLRKFTEYLTNVSLIQTNIFNNILEQEKKLSLILRTYVNLQFEYFEGTAIDKIYVDSFVNSVNVCMEKFIEQVSSYEFNFDYLNCNGSNDILAKKINEFSNTNSFTDISYISKILDILKLRKSSINAILDAKKLINFYAEETFENIVDSLVNNIKMCIAGKISETNYLKLINLIDALEIDLSFNELDIQKRIDLISNENIFIEGWINSKL
ncbi:uncharacterized protein LOC129608452 [Condylostylus longicornis]|uniref:uncharacterized protein LOC129608452 n=1 Tax=Condylostylus longicornis TaxID=2530218 RepID=UPI00244E0015|nr:uncharacterized protein LOC129608452 [Condylostylus longicornis]